MFRGLLSFWVWGNYTPTPLPSGGGGGMMMVQAGYLRHRTYRQQIGKQE